MMRPSHLIACYCLVAASAAAEPLISEFMASNQTGLADENGSRPDWIEIRNPDAAPALLTGWALTDSAADPQKWLFPAVTVPPNGHLVVFASGKDRRVAGQNLHTNFSLSAGGEYLALVRPDGTATTAWAPAYPVQYPDISYGTSTNIGAVMWVQQSTAVKAFVPAPLDTSLIPQWRAVGFADAAWTAGTFGVGYMTASANPDLSGELGVNLLTPMNGTGRHSYSRALFNVPDKTAVVSIRLRMNYDDGFVAWINGTLAANSAGAPTTDPISPTALVGSHPPSATGAFEEFTVPPAAVAALVNGENVLAIEGMNTSTGSSDCVVIPQLIGSVNNPGAGVTGYFTVATPGIVNGGVSTIQLPNAVTFSRAAGTYSASFSLTLGGTLPGQEIRYNITDPSGSGAAAPEPTAASTLYTAPVPLTMTGGKLIRAAIFHGTQRSRTITQQYLPLETAAGPNNTSGFTSILPVIVLDDHGDGEPVDSGGNTFTTTMMHVFPPVDGVARLADAVSGNGVPEIFARTGTRVRGSSSAGFAKKSYGMETWDEKNVDRDVTLLGLAADSDWILSGPFFYDDTYIHNAYIHEVSRRIGRWAPRTVACEVFFNQNGGKLDYNDYAGVYILTEKIKSGSERLEITGIEPGDNAGSALTGGYIFKIDRPDGGEFSWEIPANTVPGGPALPFEQESQLVLVEPDPDFDTIQQQNYIRDNATLTWHNTLFGERTANFATRNYRTHIDAGSFVDHHLLNSLAYNVDALRLSAFFFKDRNGKIHAGPIWDFDRSLGSDDDRDNNPAGWGSIDYFFSRDWWGGLFKDPQFVQEVVDRWWELRQPGRTFETAALHLVADQMGAQIGNAAGARDATRWAPDNNPRSGVFLNEIADMKSWLTSRVNFLDGAMPGPPAASVASGPVSQGATVTFSGAGTIRYTLDGTDPRPFGGATPGPGSTYTGPFTINATTVVTARRQIPTTPFPGGAVSIAWSAPLTRVYLVNESFAAAADLSISEINYHPAGPTPAELAAAPGAGSNDFEWIELKNTGATAVNTFEMTFPAGFPFEKELRLNARSLAPGQSALVVKNRAAFQARYGASHNARIAGEWRDGNLDDSGEEIRLLARAGSTVASFTYSDGSGWPDRADGKGAVLEYTGALFTTADYQTAANWRSSSEIHGSPGAAGAGPDTRIVINEILSHSNLPRVDAIELRNNTAEPVNVGGWFLSDTGSIENVLEYQKFAIPAGTIIQPGGYAVFTETSFNPNGAWNPVPGPPGANEFAFDGQHGDDAWLISNTAGVLRFADHVDFGAARPDESWGRLPNGTGPLVPLLTRTLLAENISTFPRPGLGADNSGIRTGPLILQEIHHAPPGGNTDLEFVEIFNPGPTAVSLANWWLRGDVDYNFFTESIPVGGLLVVVPFAPSDALRASQFRSAYGLDQTVILAGPWDGGDHLSTNGRVTLYRAETPPAAEPGFYPHTVEDKAAWFGNSTGWPNTTAGLSLHRAIRDNASVAVNWFASAPTPGDAFLRFGYWKSLHLPATGPGSGDSDDPDGDGLSNALEFALRTAPLSPDKSAAVLPSLTTRAGPAGSTDLIFNYTRPSQIPGVIYTVEKSVGLAGWTAVPDTVVATTATTETRRTIVNSDGQLRLFLRLNVSITP